MQFDEACVASAKQLIGIEPASIASQAATQAKGPKRAREGDDGSKQPKEKKASRGTPAQRFVLQYWTNIPTSLDPEVLITGLKINVVSLRTVVDKRGCCFSLMTTSSRYRLSSMVMKLTPYLYNANARGGAKINGDEGLMIFIASDETADQFNEHLEMLEKVFNGDTSLGSPVPGWQLKTSISAEHNNGRTVKGGALSTIADASKSNDTITKEALKTPADCNPCCSDAVELREPDAVHCITNAPEDVLRRQQALSAIRRKKANDLAVIAAAKRKAAEEDAATVKLRCDESEARLKIIAADAASTKLLCEDAEARFKMAKLDADAAAFRRGETALYLAEINDKRKIAENEEIIKTVRLNAERAEFEKQRSEFALERETTATEVEIVKAAVLIKNLEKDITAAECAKKEFITRSDEYATAVSNYISESMDKNDKAEHAMQEMRNAHTRADIEFRHDLADLELKEAQVADKLAIYSKHATDVECATTAAKLKLDQDKLTSNETTLAIREVQALIAETNEKKSSHLFKMIKEMRDTIPRDANGDVIDKRFLVYLDSELLNVCMDGTAQQLDTTTTISREVVNLKYGKFTLPQLGVVGKHCAKIYRAAHNKQEPDKHMQYVDGGVRDINTYNDADVNMIHAAIHLYADKYGIQRQ